MLTIDTNILIRYLMSDDPVQSPRARNFIGSVPVFVPTTVVLETAWVLRSTYGYQVSMVSKAIRAVAGLPGVTLEDATRVLTALDWTDAGLDFADALHMAAAGPDGFVSFDKALVRKGEAIAGIPVSEL